jgi:hypothetical protein
MVDAVNAGAPHDDESAPEAVQSDAMPDRGTKRRRRRRRVGIGLIVLLVLFAAITARVFVWPALPPLPAHADAIVELAGASDEGRDALALKLGREHRAPYMAESTAGTGNWCSTRLRGEQTQCFRPDPNTTQGEARWIGEQAKEHNWKSVILVTTPDQAYRAKLRVGRCFPGQVYVATSDLPWTSWFKQIPYQWGATVKALTWQRSC